MRSGSCATTTNELCTRFASEKNSHTSHDASAPATRRRRLMSRGDDACHGSARQRTMAGLALPAHKPEGRAFSYEERHTMADTAKPKSGRSEEHTSELQSRFDLVCRLLLEKKI